MIMGAILLCTNRAPHGIAECERALSLDHNLAEAHAQIGTAKHLLARGAEVEEHMREAFRLSPRDAFAFRWLMIAGFAKLHIEADTKAVECFLRSIEANRNFAIAHFGLAASLALVGHRDQARAAVETGLALNPTFTIHRFRDGIMSNNPAFLVNRERVYEGMRMAGIPEG